MADGNISLKKIKLNAQKLFETKDIDALNRSIDILFSDLLKKKMIEKV